MILGWEVKSQSEFTLPKEWAKIENRKRAYGAERQVYAPLGDAGLLRLVMKHKDKRPLVKSSSFAEEGLADVILPRRRQKR